LQLVDGKKGIGSYVEDITEEKNRAQADKKNLMRMAMLVEILSTSFESSQDQLDEVVGKAVALTESVYGFLYLYEETTQQFSEFTLCQQVRYKIETTLGHNLGQNKLWQQVIQTRKPVINNTFQETGFSGKPLPKGHPKVTSFLALPVIIHDRIVAVIGLCNKIGGYQENDIYQVSLLMTGIWNAREKSERDKELQESKENLRLILDSTAEGIFGLDRKGNCTFCNASCLELLGYENEQDLLGTEILTLIKSAKTIGSALEFPQNSIFSPFVTGQGINLEDLVFQRSDGTSFDVECNAYPQWKNGEIVGSVITFSNNTEKKQNMEKIKYLGDHDPLTGLYNRSFFEQEKLRVEMKGKLPLSLIIGDVNGLKLSNDIFGHSQGDSLLKNIGSVMKRVCNPNDSLSRIGGDEFVMFLANTNEQGARDRVSKIQSILDEEFPPLGKDSISLGYATKNRTEVSLEKVFKQAENSMYSEKTLHYQEMQKKQLMQLELQLYEKLPEEKLHSKNIGQLCRNMGELLHLEEDELRRLSRSGYLHDIGKVVLDNEILSKTTMDEQAMKEIYRHTVVGFRILKSFEETMDLALGILYHHEHWDGSGYPKKLKGEEIPLDARILRLGETLDTLFRENGKDEESLRQALQQLSGTVLDPALVSLYLTSLALPEHLQNN
jgi:diguanylate cyclase (GGDEF)-like protein/PAS domain S-box-containing protein